MLLKIGLFNLKTKQLEKHNPEIIATNLIPHVYNPEAYSKLVEDVLNKMCCNDAELRMLLEEMIGYTFYRSCKFKAAFFLYGPKANNGKSTFLETLKSTLGKENYTALSLDNLKDRFKTAELAGKLANIGDDIDANFISDISVFKKLSDGDTIMAERKGKDPFQLENYATLIFSANRMPKTGDKTDGLLTRMTIIPFNAVFDKNAPDFNRFIGRDLQKEESLEYMIKIGVNGLLRLLDNGGVFTEPSSVENAKVEYKLSNDTLLQFLQYLRDEDKNTENYTPSQLYQEYANWCKNNGLDKPMSSNSFGTEMKRLGYEKKQKTIEGKRVWYYIKNG